jgi:hypothetical protein
LIYEAFGKSEISKLSYETASNPYLRKVFNALRVLNEREPAPTAAIYDSRTLSSTPESGAQTDCNGHKKTKNSKVPVAINTLGHPLALRATPGQ